MASLFRTVAMTVSFVQIDGHFQSRERREESSGEAYSATQGIWPSRCGRGFRSVIRGASRKRERKHKYGQCQNASKFASRFWRENANGLRLPVKPPSLHGEFGRVSCGAEKKLEALLAERAEVESASSRGEKQSFSFHRSTSLQWTLPPSRVKYTWCPGS